MANSAIEQRAKPAYMFRKSHVELRVSKNSTRERRHSKMIRQKQIMAHLGHGSIQAINVDCKSKSPAHGRCQSMCMFVCVCVCVFFKVPLFVV